MNYTVFTIYIYTICIADWLNIFFDAKSKKNLKVRICLITFPSKIDAQ